MWSWLTNFDRFLNELIKGIFSKKLIIIKGKLQS